MNLIVITVVLSVLVILGSVGVLGVLLQEKPSETVELTEAGNEILTIAGIELPDAVSDQLGIVGFSNKKVRKTTSVFLTSSFGKELSSKSDLHVSFCLL